MRIRSTKPEFWRSKTIAQLDWDTRLVLKALEGYVDDNGVGKDSLVIFCADAFPYDLANSSETCAKVSRSLDRLSEAGLIVRYTFNGELLVYVRRWKKWQYIDKPKAGRYPRPDGTLNYIEDVDESIGAGQYSSNAATTRTDPKSSPKPREDCAKTSENYPQIQSGEQGNRGTGEQCVSTHDSPFCPKHPNGTKRRCGDCGNARTAFNAAKQRRDQLEADELEERRRERETLKTIAANCELCDGVWVTGTDPAIKCTHEQVSNA